ncbi:MAG: PD40 domain-containing protein [Labilithrix sp.]|nr:PD40 domain-containing protein [Labilithrix sp.]MBX3214598.1 PD40 domain-containing protein [Labilithrix sp.]
MKRWARVGGWGVVVGAWLVAVACVGEPPRELSARGEAADGAGETGATEAERDAAPAPSGQWCDPSAPFSVVEDVRELNSDLTVGNLAARLTPDSLQVFFSRGLTSEDYRIFRARRASRDLPFEPPTEVEGLDHSAGAVDSYPFLLSDGAAMYFHRARSPGGDRDIFVATATGAGFTAATPVSGASSASVNERSPYVARDGTVWFVIHTNEVGASKRIVSASRARADSFEPSAEVDLHTPDGGSDDAPVISSDGLTLYFSSTRGATNNTSDIWVARRAAESAPWKTPEPMTSLNTASVDAPSWLSPDGCELYFDRFVTAGYRIFRARRR